jgi:hypothetical protein
MPDPTSADHTDKSVTELFDKLYQRRMIASDWYSI